MRTVVTAIWTGILAVLMLIGGTGAVVDTVSAEEQDAGADVDFPSLNVTQERVTGVLGGGNFIGIHNKANDAMIGILYGTAENQNNVYVVSIFTRYLGVADIYGENGAKLASGKPIPVRTLYAQKFDTLYEFSDMDANGIWDSRRMSEQGSGGGNGGQRGMDEENMTMEPVFKKVPLSASWESSGIKKKDNGNSSVEWSIKLTAKDLTYRGPIFGTPLPRLGKLEKVELTFHLYVKRSNVTRDDIPAYRVEVQRGLLGGYNIQSTERIEERSYNGTSLSAQVKYDHMVGGWDFSQRNPSPHLLMSTEILFLNGASPRVSEFLRNLREKDFEGNGTVDYDTPSGEQRVQERNAIESPGDEPVVSQSSVQPKLVRKNRLGIADNWQKVGQLRWVSNVTVDGNEDQMFFQAYFARAFRGINANGAFFSGMGVVGGFSYPGGNRIFHDPVYEASSFQINTDGENTHPLIRILIVGGLVIAAAAVIVVLAVTAVSALMAVKRKDSLISAKKWKEEEEEDYETYYMDR